MNVYRRIEADPARWFSPDEVEKARSYQRPLTYLRVAKGVVGAAGVVAIIGTHAAPRLVEALGRPGSWVVRLLLVLAGLVVVSEAWGLPFEVWREFVHERRWGFSTQTPARFAGDLAKSLVLGFVLLALLMVPLWALMRWTDLWWVAGWLVFLLFSVVLALLLPVVIIPMFNKLEPLGDAGLAAELRELGRTAGLNISGVDVMDASKRTKKDNAFFAGLGKTRRVVLFDNLLEQPARSIRLVVAHELGHWRRHHIVHQIVVGTALSFGLFALLRLISTWEVALDWAGVTSIEDPASLPLVMLVLGAGQLVLGYVQAWHSRALEREADIEALRLTGDAAGFQDTMRRLMTKNLSELAPSRLSYLRLDHPPPAERLQLAEVWRGESQPAGALGT
jgi:STE24 endopeptidase